MKIAIATGPWFPVPAIQGGAVPRAWQGLAEEFVAQGHQVEVLCRAYPGQPKEETLKGVRYIRRGGLPQSTNIWLDLVKDLLYALFTYPSLPAADILVINDFWLPVFAQFHHNCGKVVVNVNRFPKGQYPLYRGVDRFAVVSKSVQDEIAHQYPSAISRMRLIPNPLDVRIFTPARTSQVERAEKVILYVGRIHPEKGLDLLIDGFTLLSQTVSNVKLRIVGPHRDEQGGGGESYLSHLKKCSQGLNIEFHAPIFDASKLANIYKNADLFCYPSIAEKGESFGVAPLEAMASGIVPIVSDLQCFKDFVKHNQTGYCFDHNSPNAAQALAEIIQKALLDEQGRKHIAAKALKAAQNYGYSKVAKLYLDDFAELLKEGPFSKLAHPMGK